MQQAQLWQGEDLTYSNLRYTKISSFQLFGQLFFIACFTSLSGTECGAGCMQAWQLSQQYYFGELGLSQVMYISLELDHFSFQLQETNYWRWNSRYSYGSRIYGLICTNINQLTYFKESSWIKLLLQSENSHNAILARDFFLSPILKVF